MPLSEDLYATVGCHPTRSAEFDKYSKGPEGYLQALDEHVTAHLNGPGRAVAIGECGLGAILNTCSSPPTAFDAYY
jgi:TatD DNase family protein